MFSIVVPTFNRSNLLCRALESVLSQSFRDFELIVVDDCSTDNTEVVVKGYDDPRIHYIKRVVNGSAGASRNTGIRAAQHPWVVFLDDDDELLPGFLERHAQCIQDHQGRYGLYWSGSESVREFADGTTAVSESIWAISFATREGAYRSFLKTRHIGTCGIVIDRAVFDKIGVFDEQMRKAEDTDFFIRLVREFDFFVVPEILMRVHLHEGPRLTCYTPEMAAAYEMIMAKNKDAVDGDSSVFAALHYKTGWLHYHCGGKSSARKHLWAVLRQNPLFYKAWIVLLIFELLPTATAVRIHRKLAGVTA